MTDCLGMADAFSNEPKSNTCDLPNNVFTKDTKRSKRVDFVFHSDEFCGDQCLNLINRKLTLTDNIPGKGYPYSDHAGIEAIFKITKNRDGNKMPKPFTKMSSKELYRIAC